MGIYLLFATTTPLVYTRLTMTLRRNVHADSCLPLQGAVPSDIGRLRLLRQLGLNNNQISGGLRFDQFPRAGRVVLKT